MDEKAMLEQIRKSAEEIEIPKALEPEQMKKRLKPKPGRKIRYAYIGRRMAAVVALCLGLGGVCLVTTVVNHSKQHADGTESQLMQEAEKEQAEESKPVTSLADAYRLAESYEDVYNVLKESKEGNSTTGTDDGMDVMESEMLESSQADMSAETNDFSGTNLVVDGVDESDWVKTDGDYIYTIEDNHIVITDIRDNALSVIKTIRPPMNIAADEIRQMYVDGDRLILIVEKYDSSMREQETAEQSEDYVICDVMYMEMATETTVLTYDISDKEKPVLLGQMTQDGSYQTSRKIGDILYVFTNYTPDESKMTARQALSKSGLSKWIPSVAGALIESDSIYLSEYGQSGILMASVDITEPEQAIDSKLVINQYADVYVSTDAIYLYSTDYADSICTTIAKFALEEDGGIEAVDAAVVSGRIEDTFAINESDGYLYVLTTDWTPDGMDTNKLSVFDEDMRAISSIDGIAEGERIYAARFLGDTAYFVTYRNTDPLFKVDLSNPYQPTIVGELKVSGFSEYLHFWDDTHLIGIGYETDEETGMREGVKISMFNIEDSSNVVEEARYIMPEADDSPAMWEYKSVLISKEKNIIGFTTNDYADDKMEYHAFSYENGSFCEKMTADMEGSWTGSELRSLYSENILYLIGYKTITSYDMEQDYSFLKERK